MKMKKFITILLCITLLAVSASAADVEWLFTHNGHDSLIVGEVTKISDGTADIKVIHHIVSKLPDSAPNKQLTPEKISIKDDYTCFGFIEANARKNQVGDIVIMSLQKEGDVWSSDACYLADRSDYQSLNILIPPMKDEDMKSAAAFHSMFIKSFINSDGASAEDPKQHKNISEIKSKAYDGSYIYYTTASASELIREADSESTPTKPKTDYTRLFIVTGCGAMFLLLMFFYRKIKE